MHLLSPGWRILSAALALTPQVLAAAQFRAGAYAVDVSPIQFPVRVNAMFTERSATNVNDTLYAKSLAFDDGSERIVMCVVDSCMVPRSLIDSAKAKASAATGLPVNHMLVSSTHTHSAPSAMGCLGSREDPNYAALLPERIANSIIGAVRRLAPARIAWGQTNDWEHTFNRRWIRRPDRILTDPFGQPTVRANMHPGHQSPDVVGPSGPVDPQLSVLAVQTLDGRPLALLANYSMHYYGSPLLSSDYYGRFANYARQQLGADDAFVAIMSQGTSGDLMWMDYSAPAHEVGYDAYARQIAQRTTALIATLAWQDTAPLHMAEQCLELGYRLPDQRRLAWAEQVRAVLGDKLPQTQPEIYALEAIALHEQQRTQVLVQALAIGNVGIAAIPNEVFAITGLKLKLCSPLPVTFSIELANGAEGYIPPPEQHILGGYTTWPARTAGLEAAAEPRIVETALSLLEKVSGKPRQVPVAPSGPYALAVLEAKPMAYWRLEELAPPIAHNAVANKFHGALEGPMAFYLPGVDGRLGFQPTEPLALNAFSGSQINRSLHLAGGFITAQLPLQSSFSVEFWIWNGLPSDARPITGILVAEQPQETPAMGPVGLGIGGTAQLDSAGCLFMGDFGRTETWRIGTRRLERQSWHHVVYVRQREELRVYLDGDPNADISTPMTLPVFDGNRNFFFGGFERNGFNLEGKLDEISIYGRALSSGEISSHYAAAALHRAPTSNEQKSGQAPKLDSKR